ncbi:DUF6264 family protein [Microbacterium sp. zg.Y1090]|uniref:DUF6264 family protein n=1 Tax=Microbacterium TaxID=33882 RepID=UPI00214BEFD3|nr:MULTISPECIES: DUF6264 family protein [unclassified Microbacterium]MCR2812151.1 DUF6264 family protein [Microbacterium sp. zg.Y1084]MCR2818411.1 DUF6264 family protein [Microbacterium sp. zg.Y1090]MDL5486224.1 DUF6264 family protein [Microbacterium sp. zg-Y1211]WIM29422.1 DUF6264 family protein [Microbacterium sp. zg-Y1090]
MSDIDPRPRPQYGEYATPEEQRARIAQPDATDALSSGVAPQAGMHDASQPRGGSAPFPAEPATSAVARPTRMADRVITLALLAYGLVTVLVAAPQMLDVGAFAQTMFQTLGVDAQLADPESGRGWGVAAATALAGGWVLTAWLSWRSLAARRLTWWIPLVGGILFNFVSGTLMVIPIMNDPAAWEALQRTVSG